MTMRSYGGGAGMVMQPEPIYDAYEALAARTGKRPRVIHLTRRGRFSTRKSRKNSERRGIWCPLHGHYEDR